jgi:hypothetical protein
MDCIAASFQVEGCAAQRFDGVQIQGDMPRQRFAEWSERNANRPARPA